MHPARVIVTKGVSRLDVELSQLRREGLSQARSVGQRLLRAHGPGDDGDDNGPNRHTSTGDREAVKAAVRRRKVDRVGRRLCQAGIGRVADAAHRQRRVKAELRREWRVGGVGAHRLLCRNVLCQSATRQAEDEHLEGGDDGNHELVVGAVVRGGVEVGVRRLHQQLGRRHSLGDLVVARAAPVVLLVQAVAAARSASRCGCLRKA